MFNYSLQASCSPGPESRGRKKSRIKIYVKRQDGVDTRLLDICNSFNKQNWRDTLLLQGCRCTLQLKQENIHKLTVNREENKKL